MKTLTTAEALIALSIGEKITSDLMNGVYIFLDGNRIVDSFGNEANGLYLESIFRYNACIYKEQVVKYKYVFQYIGCEPTISRLLTEEEADEMFKLIPCQRLDFTKITV